MSQVWRETLCQRDMLAALKKKRSRALGGGYGTLLNDNNPMPTSGASSSSGSSSSNGSSNSSSSSSGKGSGSGSGNSNSGNGNGSGSIDNSHGAAMEAMNGALDLGDVQLVRSYWYTLIATVGLSVNQHT